MGTTELPEQIACPGCGRRVSAKAKACLYCRADVAAGVGSREAGAPAQRAVADVTCAFCKRVYAPAMHPTGCPACRAQMSALGERVESERVASSTGRFAAAMGLLAIVLGVVGAAIADSQTSSAEAFRFSGGLVASVLAVSFVLGAGATLAVVRFRDWRAEREPELVSTVVFTIAGAFFSTPVVLPWAIVIVMGLNAAGLEHPFPLVPCTLGTTSYVHSKRSGGRYETSVHCDVDGEAVNGTIVVFRSEIAVEGLPVRVHLAKGRLGIWLRDRSTKEDFLVGGAPPASAEHDAQAP